MRDGVVLHVGTTLYTFHGNKHRLSHARQDEILSLTSVPPAEVGSVGLSHLRLPPRLTTPVAVAASSVPLPRASKLDPDLGADSRSPAAEELTIPWMLEPFPLLPLRPRPLPPPPPPPAPLLLWLLPLPPRLLLPPLLPLLPLSGAKRPLAPAPAPFAPPLAKERMRRRGWPVGVLLLLQAARTLEAAFFSGGEQGSGEGDGVQATCDFFRVIRAPHCPPKEQDLLWLRSVPRWPTVACHVTQEASG